MSSMQLAFAALALGAVIGGTLAVLLLLSLRARDRARMESSLALPDGTRAVLQGMDDVAIVVDTSGRIVAASAPAELFGLREGAGIGDDDLRALVRQARRIDHPESSTFRLRRGIEPRLVIARASVITPRLTLVVIRDITERERLEQMRRDFVANTSHELKTPVGAVSLLAEAIDSAADDPEQVRRFAGRLTAEASRLAQLTARIMHLSRLQSADELSEVRDVSIDEVVASAIETQSVAADAAGVSITRGGVRGTWVRGDGQILTDAVANLVANAVAYSTQGGKVGIGVKAGEDWVEIAVTDRGIGIPEGEQERIFERFYRADQARSRRTGGTGLGLSIVKHAVQRHGGEVEVWSRPDRGSTFTVRLPRIPAPEGAAGRKPKKSAKKSAKKSTAADKKDKKGSAT